MRVIGGEFRSRKLKSLEGLETRPTPDRLRETLFNILAPVIEGAVFVDAYAGTGSVGIEALSRGAARAVFVERSRAAVGVIQENLSELRVGGRAEVLGSKVLQVAARVGGDIWFLDPPYEMAAEYGAVLDLLGTQDAALVVVQHARKLELAEGYGKLQRYRQVKQGDNLLSFYRTTILSTV